jgi:heat-inducible transcriptional repressor
MVTETNIDNRKKAILYAAVQEYILTAEPVSSQKLVEKYRLGISPATVRYELAALEDLGYLCQPYTSAGRVPTDKGYRFYVDSLADKKGLTTQEEQSVDRLFSALNREMEELMQETSLLLARLTSYIAVVLAPVLRKSTLKHIDLVALSSYDVLIVLITDTGRVVKGTLTFGKPVNMQELAEVEKQLNTALKGKGVSEIEEERAKLTESSVPNRWVIEQVIEEITNILANEQERVFLGGTSSILHQPEFEDLQKVQSLLSTLERGYLLLKLLEDAFKTKKVLVRIGSENRIVEIKDYSLVASSYRIKGEAIGTLGIIGPTRMDYARAISAVKYIADNLSKALTSLKV